MKALFFLLLAANLALAAFVWSDAVPRGESYRSEPLRPDKIRILSAGAPAPVPASIPAAAPPPAPAAPAPAACLEWGPFSTAEMAAATQAIGRLQLGERLQVRQLEDDAGYWVYIPPLKTRQDAERKIVELRNLGVTDYFLVQDNGRWKNAISLGVFRTEEAVRVQLASLQEKGVKSAQSGRREHLVKLSLFVVREPDEALAAKLVELKQEFPGSELKASACGES